MEPNETLLTTEQIATRLGFSVSTIMLMIALMNWSAGHPGGQPSITENSAISAKRQRIGSMRLVRSQRDSNKPNGREIVTSAKGRSGGLSICEGRE